MNPPFAASHVQGAVRRILFRQLKLRERRPRPRFIQGKKVDRPGILAARGDGRGNQHAGQTTCDRLPQATTLPHANTSRPPNSPLGYLTKSTIRLQHHRQLSAAQLARKSLRRRTRAMRARMAAVSRLPRKFACGLAEAKRLKTGPVRPQIEV